METDVAILEQLVDFSSELSVVAARGVDGDFAYYSPIANLHRNHILDVSVSPAPLREKTQREAVEIARQVFEKLDVVGVFKALKKIKFPADGSLSLEYESYPDNPIDDMKQCLAVARDAIAKASAAS